MTIGFKAQHRPTRQAWFSHFSRFHSKLDFSQSINIPKNEVARVGTC